MLNIHGFGDNLTINNIRIGDLSPDEHEDPKIAMATTTTHRIVGAIIGIFTILCFPCREYARSRTHRSRHVL